MKLRPATLDDLVWGECVYYTPILGQHEKAFLGFVDDEPWQLGNGVWCTHLENMGPAYGEFVGLPGKTRVCAAVLEALFVPECKDGLWTASTREDRWEDGPWFGTREDAEAYARIEGLRYVGQRRDLTDAEVARAFVRDWDDATEDLGIQDEWEWCEEELIAEPTEEAAAELLAMVEAWVKKHNLRQPRWCVLDIEKVRDLPGGTT